MIIHTIRNPWQRIRGIVGVADDVMSGTGAGGRPKMDWVARDEAKGQRIPLPGNGIIIGMMGDTEDKTVTVNSWLYREWGPAEFVISGVFRIGSREVVIDPTTRNTSSYLYADTFTVTDQNWPAEKLKVVDFDGDEGFSQIWLDAIGSMFVKIEIAAIDADLKVIPIFAHW